MARLLGRSVVLGLIFLALAAFCGTASGALMAIDYGSENMKISLVAPGRTPISIVTNEMSRRKSPAAVCFNQGERLLGEDAVALAARFPGRVFLRSRDMLGVPADSPDLAALLQRLYLPYVVTPDGVRGTVRLAAHTGEDYSAEELVGMVLHYARSLAEAQAKSVVRDAVITVPPYMGQAQRAALLDAAALADLNVLALVSDHVGAALQWGIDKDFGANGSVPAAPQLIVIYDLGANHASAALVRYSALPAGRDAGPKAKPSGQFEVLAVEWDVGVGCEALDLLLVEHFADEYTASAKPGSVNLRSVPEAMAKLKKAAKRTKEILSANAAAPISVEGLLPDVDFRSSITRETFETLAASAGVWDRAAAPLAAVLAATATPAESLTAMELVGGCTRVPRVATALSAVLGGRAVDRHLDADEAAVLGAGLYAANLSTAFRVRKFGAQDASPYAITLDVEGEGLSPRPGESDATSGDDGAAEDADAPSSKRRLLVPRWKRMPVDRVVTLHGLREGATLTTAYDDRPGAPLPPGAPGASLYTYTVTGMADVAAKHNVTGEAKAHFALSRSGVLTLDRVDAVINVTYIEQPKPVKAANVNATAAANGTAANGTTSAESTAPAADADAAAEPPPPPAGIVRHRTARVALHVSPPTTAPGAAPLTPVGRRASATLLESLAAKDGVKRAAAEAKNALEAYVIRTRERLASDSAWAAVTTPAQRSSLAAQLSAQEDWLYDGGEDATAEEFRRRLGEVQAGGGAIAHRVTEAAARPQAIAAARDALAAVEATLAAMAETKPWVNETDKAGVRELAEEARAWLDGKVKDQAARAAHEDPAFDVSELKRKLAPMLAELTKLERTPKPPKAAKATTDNATASSDGEPLLEKGGEATPPEGDELRGTEVPDAGVEKLEL